VTSMMLRRAFLRQRPHRFFQHAHYLNYQTPSSCCLCTTGSRYHSTETTVQVGVSNNYNNVSSQKAGDKKGKQADRRSGKHHNRFVDRVRVRVAGGTGGNGSQSLLRISRKHKRKPDGGHGGSGGSVIIVADPTEQTLRSLRPHVTADAGTHGTSQKMHGRNGKNTIIRVPCGVVVRRVLDYDEKWDEATGSVKKMHQDDEFDGMPMQTDPRVGRNSQEIHDESDSDSDSDDDWSKEEEEEKRRKRRTPVLLSADESDNIFKDYLNEGDDYDPDFHFVPWGEREKVDIADLDKPGSYVVVATGGRGGVGSSIFASRHGPIPPPEVLSGYAKPRDGEKAALELELKLIADIGLVGFPNAGKSSLLAAMSRATPEIAPYPFTTMNPIVGYIEYKDGYRVCAADVPGLIEGAAEGRGMGHDFLRHLERTKALLYIVDAAGVDGRDPVEDLQILVEELEAYGGGDMLRRHALVVANKMDLLSETRKLEVMSRLADFCNDADLLLQEEVIGISAGVSGEGLFNLSKAIRQTVALSENEMKRLDSED
jgi:GTP-binding protein